MKRTDSAGGAVVKRTELKRKGAPKRTQPKRDWTEARAKVDAEGMCRVRGRYGECAGKLEAAHIIGRELDLRNVGVTIRATPSARGLTHHVKPLRIVPLCTRHHKAYDAHELDLLGFLTPEEEAQAVLDADGLEAARRRLCPSEYRKAVA